MLLLIAFEAFSYSPICIALLEASVAFVTAELTAMHMTMTIIPSSVAIAIMGRTVRTIAGTMSRMRSMRGRECSSTSDSCDKRCKEANFRGRSNRLIEELFLASLIFNFFVLVIFKEAYLVPRSYSSKDFIITCTVQVF